MLEESIDRDYIYLSVPNKSRGYDGPRHRARKARGFVRAKEMLTKYESGLTLKEIGKMYGVSRQAIEQHMKKYLKYNPKNGGGAIIAKKNQKQRKIKRDQYCLNHYGCTDSEWRTIPLRARRAFVHQRRSSAYRGIEWEFNLWQWWCLWRDSGHWDCRGRGQGYCMSRRGDIGPYSPENCFIQPVRENSGAHHRRLSGLPVGVRKSGDKYYAIRQINGRKYRAGGFVTIKEAQAAYRAFNKTNGASG